MLPEERADCRLEANCERVLYLSSRKSKYGECMVEPASKLTTVTEGFIREVRDRQDMLLVMDRALARLIIIPHHECKCQHTH